MTATNTTTITLLESPPSESLESLEVTSGERGHERGAEEAR